MLTGIFALAVLAQGPGSGESSADAAAAAPSMSKKEAYLASKRGAAEQAQPQDERKARRAPRRAKTPVWAHNLRTHEIMPLSDLRGLADTDFDRFFQCWFTREHGDIPSELVERIISTARLFEVREVRVISGFRHPKYNLSLRKKGREVARRSQHTKASAIDFFLPGIDTRKLYDHLLEHHGGGVGFYPISEFVHIDTGKKRTWKGT